MRVSIKMKAKTKNNIRKLKEMWYEKEDRVRDSYIINRAFKENDEKTIEEILNIEKKDANNYPAIYFNLDNNCIGVMESIKKSTNVTYDQIINKFVESSINNCKLEMYKERCRLMRNIKCTIVTPEITQMLLPSIYSYRLGSLKNKEKNFVLYAGKSKLLLNRTSTHLATLIDDLFYFGLTEEVINNPALFIEIRIEKDIDVSNCNNMKEFNRFLCEQEQEVVNRLEPLLMDGMNLKTSSEEKCEIVKQIIKKLSDE